MFWYCDFSHTTRVVIADKYFDIIIVNHKENNCFEYVYVYTPIIPI